MPVHASIYEYITLFKADQALKINKKKFGGIKYITYLYYMEIEKNIKGLTNACILANRHSLTYSNVCIFVFKNNENTYNIVSEIFSDSLPIDAICFNGNIFSLTAIKNEKIKLSVNEMRDAINKLEYKAMTTISLSQEFFDNLTKNGYTIAKLD